MSLRYDSSVFELLDKQQTRIKKVLNLDHEGIIHGQGVKLAMEGLSYCLSSVNQGNTCQLPWVKVFHRMMDFCKLSTLKGNKEIR